MTASKVTNNLICTPEDISILMTVPELAEYLGIGRNRAYELLKKDMIHGFRIGNNWKVSKAAVDDFIKKKSRLA